MIERYNAKHTPIPRHKTSEDVYMPGEIKYMLTPVELEHARANRTDLIPTAAQRGLTAPPVQPRVFEQPKVESRKEPASPEVSKSITAEMLQIDTAAKMTNKEIGKKYGISSSTVSKLLVKFGLANQKGVQRQHKRGGSWQ